MKPLDLDEDEPEDDGDGFHRKAPFAVGFVAVRWRGQAFDGYAVSADGQIWSQKSKKILTPFKIGRPPPYDAVGLRRNGSTVKCPIHQIVAEAFLGPRPPGFDVCHSDGVRENNSVGNLRYATRSENLADREKHGTHQRGERNPSAVLSNVQAQQVRIARMRGEPLALIAKRFGVRESTVSRIVNGRRRAR